MFHESNIPSHTAQASGEVEMEEAEIKLDKKCDDSEDGEGCMSNLSPAGATASAQFDDTTAATDEYLHRRTEGDNNDEACRGKKGRKDKFEHAKEVNLDEMSITETALHAQTPAEADDINTVSYIERNIEIIDNTEGDFGDVD